MLAIDNKRDSETNCIHTAQVIRRSRFIDDKPLIANLILQLYWKENPTYRKMPT